MDSQGRISFETDASEGTTPDGTVSDDDLYFLRSFEPEGSEARAAAAPASDIDDATRPSWAARGLVPEPVA